jgi:hypothetical protein
MEIEEILIIDRIELEKNDQKWQIDGKESNGNQMNYPIIDQEMILIEIDPIEVIMDDVKHSLFSLQIIIKFLFSFSKFHR